MGTKAKLTQKNLFKGSKFETKFKPSYFSFEFALHIFRRPNHFHRFLPHDRYDHGLEVMELIQTQKFCTRWPTKVDTQCEVPGRVKASYIKTN